MDRIQDRIHWGLNIAARALGETADAYRPSGPGYPLDPSNRYLRLHAAFEPLGRAGANAEPVWSGIFDAAYTRPGDYVVQGDAVWFIASQRRLQPLLCVQTNRVISARRPGPAMVAGAASYGGPASGQDEDVFTAWPASMLLAGNAGLPQAGLPADLPVPTWTILLPDIPGATPMPSDMITDDTGACCIVTASERNSLGWRLMARQVTA